jgi:phosphinothricin acetyltransferase
MRGQRDFGQKRPTKLQSKRQFYCAPGTEGRGIGTRLYSALFEAISTADIHRILAGYVLPNSASAALHERFGFKLVGVFSENGRKLDRYYWDVAWTERPWRV